MSMAILDLVFDIVVMLLPLPIIYKLHMSKKKRYYLVAVFWLGSM